MKSLCPIVRALNGIASASFSSLVLRFFLIGFSSSSGSSFLTTFALGCRFLGAGLGASSDEQADSSSSGSGLTLRVLAMRL